MGVIWPDGILAPMAEKITPETFQHLVQLAALELDEAEAEYLLGELNKQLQAIEELAAIPLDTDTPATSHGVPYAAAIRPPLRADEAAMDPNVDAIKGQAPEMDDEYIMVPDIPKEDL
jgi:aspartyl/glutamyl-tRNA(Asn/Gln) amidotransferase C subunit